MENFEKKNFIDFLVHLKSPNASAAGWKADFAA